MKDESVTGEAQDQHEQEEQQPPKGDGKQAARRLADRQPQRFGQPGKEKRG